MIAVIKTDSGNYNLFGTRDDLFVLEGNLSLDELKDLKAKIDKVLKAK